MAMARTDEVAVLELVDAEFRAGVVLPVLDNFFFVWGGDRM